MDNKWVWVAVGGVVLLLLFMNRSGSSSAASGPTLDPNAEEASRLNFASQGFAALTQFASADAQAKSQSAIAGYQAQAEQARDNVLLETARLQAGVQSKAQQNGNTASIIGSIATVATAILAAL